MNDNLLRLRNLADANPYVGARTRTILRLQVVAQNLAVMPVVAVHNLRSSAEAFVLLAAPMLPDYSQRFEDRTLRAHFRSLLNELVDHDALVDLCTGQPSLENTQTQKGE